MLLEILCTCVKSASQIRVSDSTHFIHRQNMHLVLKADQVLHEINQTNAYIYNNLLLPSSV